MNRNGRHLTSPDDLRVSDEVRRHGSRSSPEAMGCPLVLDRAPRRVRRLVPPPRFVPRDGASGREEGAPSAPAEQEAPKAKDAAEPEKDQDAAPAPDAAPPPATDPSQTRRVAPIEVFKDDVAQAMLGLEKVSPLPPVAFTGSELAQVREMAANPNLGFNRPIVDRVVRGLTARLTDKKNIQALLEMPEEDPKAAVPKKGAAPKKPLTDGGKAIEEATTDLLDPIFRARGSKNEQFLSSLPADPQSVPAPAHEESPRAPRAGHDRAGRGRQPRFHRSCSRARSPVARRPSG